MAMLIPVGWLVRHEGSSARVSYRTWSGLTALPKVSQVGKGKTKAPWEGAFESRIATSPAGRGRYSTQSASAPSL